MITRPMIDPRPRTFDERVHALFFTSLIVVALLAMSACGEQRRERFASGADALASETARRGWIPSWLPREAIAVDIRYDLDTNFCWLSFRLHPVPAAALQQQLRPLSPQQVRQITLRSPRGYLDWPEGVIQQQPVNDGALHSRILCGTGRVIPAQTCFAFEEGSDNVYVWIPREEP